MQPPIAPRTHVPLPPNELQFTIYCIAQLGFDFWTCCQSTSAIIHFANFSPSSSALYWGARTAWSVFRFSPHNSYHIHTSTVANNKLFTESQCTCPVQYLFYSFLPSTFSDIPSFPLRRFVMVFNSPYYRCSGCKMNNKLYLPFVPRFDSAANRRAITADRPQLLQSWDQFNWKSSTMYSIAVVYLWCTKTNKTWSMSPACVIIKRHLSVIPVWLNLLCISTNMGGQVELVR